MAGAATTVRHQLHDPAIKEPLLGLVSGSVAAHDHAKGSKHIGIPDYFTTCSWFSFLSFSFPFDLIKLGNQRVLKLEDLPPTPASCRSELQVPQFLRAWEEQQQAGSKGCKRSIVRALWKCLWKDIVRTGLFALLKGMGMLSSPVFLYLMVEYVSSSSSSTETGVLLLLSLVVVKVLEGLGHRHWYFGVRVIAAKMEAAIAGAVYEKALRMKAWRSSGGDGSEVVSYITVDMERLMEFVWRFHWTWLAVVIFAGGMAMASLAAGIVSSLPALGMVTLVMAGVFPIIWSMQAAQGRFMSAQGDRLRAMAEALQAMHIIKLQAWEPEFESRLASLRSLELRSLALAHCRRSSLTAIYWLTPTLLTCITLASYSLLRHKDSDLTPTLVFTVLVTFGIIQEPVRVAPEIVANLIQARISFRRIERFLQEDEIGFVSASSIHPDGGGDDGDCVHSGGGGSVDDELDLDHDHDLDHDSTSKSRLTSNGSAYHHHHRFLQEDEIGIVSTSSIHPDSHGRSGGDDGDSVAGGCVHSVGGGVDHDHDFDHDLDLDLDLDTTSISSPRLTSNGSMYHHHPCRHRIRIDNAAFSWDIVDPDAQGLGFQSTMKPALADLNLVIKDREKVAVCGAVGSGKSSLLLALLGEIPKLSGSVAMSGRVAYVAQAAWIQAMSVRDNVVFGAAYEEERYARAMAACALQADMASLSDGDLTEVGERGAKLSGGQKQRIQLARALYSDADVFLLDDPFSAVDAQTASVLFHECVMGALRDKTVVLVTHQLEFLQSVDTILVMCDGRIQQAGTYKELQLASSGFRELVSAHEQTWQAITMSEDRKSQARSRGVGRDLNSSQSFGNTALSRETEQAAARASSARQQDETVEIGGRELDRWLDYIRISKGQLAATVLLLFQALFSAAQLCANLWLARGLSATSISSGVIVGVYSGIVAGAILAFVVRNVAVARLALQASRAFSREMTASVMRAPMSFFDAAPTGRILGRASADMNAIDLDVPFTAAWALANAFDIVGVLVVTGIVAWQLVPLLLLVIVASHFLERYYETAVVQLNRMNAASKAPIASSCMEAVSGGATIRAFGRSARFRRRNRALVDRDVSAYVYKYAAFEWMVVRTELACTCALVAAAASCLLLLHRSTSSGGLVGLAVTYTLSLSGSLTGYSILKSVLSIYALSIERVAEYLLLPKEEAPESTIAAPRRWPSAGEVVLDHVQVRYRPESPLVLKGITCTFGGGQKIGVVGRTGSGKSTLVNAIFRLVEPCSGRISIDGIDVSSIALHDLRLRLGIIPQESILFQGTVRTNLDPLNRYSDISIWEALERCQLKNVVEKLPHGLETPVMHRGANWSMGQRQLFCLGRVLLKRSRVLVLDEATASLDAATDALIRGVVGDEFAASTVITIAHRIPTVIDSDMVLSLQDGMAVEFDSPKTLLDQKTSLFALLVSEYWTQSAHDAPPEVAVHSFV